MVEENRRDPLFFLDTKHEPEDSQDDRNLLVFSMVADVLPRLPVAMVDLELERLLQHHPGELPFRFQPKSLLLAL